MSGVFLPTELASGQLPTTVTTIYTAPSTVCTGVYVKNFRLFNTNTLQQTIAIYINRGSGNFQIRQIVLNTGEQADVLEPSESILLAPGHSLAAVTTTASAVDYDIDGVVES